MRRKKVFWRKGANFTCPPRAFQSIVEEHEKLYGGLDTKLLLEESRKRGHPMRSDVWGLSDSKASERYRLSVIAKMSRSIMVTVEVSNGKSIETRAAVSVGRSSTGRPRCYRPIYAVMRDPEARDEVVAEALARFRALREEYAHLKELAEIFRAIDDAD